MTEIFSSNIGPTELLVGGYDENGVFTIKAVSVTETPTEITLGPVTYAKPLEGYDGSGRICVGHYKDHDPFTACGIFPGGIYQHVTEPTEDDAKAPMGRCSWCQEPFTEQSIRSKEDDSYHTKCLSEKRHNDRLFNSSKSLGNANGKIRT